MSLPENERVSKAQFYQMYRNDELKDYLPLDHIILAKKKINNDVVWTEYP